MMAVNNTLDNYNSFARDDTDDTSRLFEERESFDNSSTYDAPAAQPERTVYIPNRSLKRYSTSFRGLAPVRRKTRIRKELPVNNTGLISFMTSNWVVWFLWKAQNSLPQYLMASPDSCHINGERLLQLYYNRSLSRSSKDISMIALAWKFIQTRVIVAVFIYAFGMCLQIAGLVLFFGEKTLFGNETGTTNTTVRHTKITDITTNDTVIYSIICTTEFLSILFISWAWSISFRTTVRFQSAIMYVLYKKLIFSSIGNPVSTQQVITFMGADIPRICSATLYLPFVIASPLVLILSCLALFIYSMKCESLLLLLTTIILIIMVPLSNAVKSWKLNAYESLTKQISSLKEIIQNFRLAKMLQWEKIIFTDMQDERKEEEKYFKYSYIWNSIGSTTIFFFIIIIFISYNMKEVQYQILALCFIPIRINLLYFWDGISFLNEAFDSLEKVKGAFQLQPVENFTTRPISHDVAFTANRASFVWKANTQFFSKANDKSCTCFKTCHSHEELTLSTLPSFKLQNISFTVMKGKIIGICGEPGAGKTSLLMSLLGHLNKLSGDVYRIGNCAYVGQKPWIYNASLKQNIMLDKSQAVKRYIQALHCCQINEDLNSLPNSDDTNLGSTVIPIGLQQKIEIARALYANRDIYLLDEPLTMVNVAARKEIFEKVFLNELRGKTIILCTQEIRFLNQCDDIYILKNGNIFARGTHEDLINSCSYYEKLVKAFLQENNKTYFGNYFGGSQSTLSSIHTRLLSSMAESTNSLDSTTHDENAILTGAESLEVISKDSFLYYYSNLNKQNMWGLMTSMIIQFICFAYIYSIQLLALPIISENDSNRQKLWEGYKQYGMILLVFILLLLSSTTSVINSIILKLSTRIYNSFLGKICCSSLTYLQTDTSASILNWFPFHIYNVDRFLSSLLTSTLQSVFPVIITLIIISYCYVWFIPPLILFGALVFVIFKIYKRALLNLYKNKLECIRKVFDEVIICIDGRTSIQSYNRESDFIGRFFKLCDETAACDYLIIASCGSLSFILHFLKVLLVGLSLTLASISMLHKDTIWELKSKENLMLAILCELQLANMIHCAITSITELDGRITTLATNSTLQSIETEENDNSKKDNFQNDWPIEGSILFQNVKMKYWPSTLLYNKGLSFKVKANSKVGIIGNPDSGKKSISNALFRLVELSQGRICVGGINISEIPLDILRSRIAIVPQEPLLFKGTIRMNLDCNQEYDTEIIYNVLGSVGLLEKIKGLPQDINTVVTAGDKLLSVGECQLLYLARALLRKVKILIVEEPLVIVSHQLQEKVKSIIFNLFSSSTVLIIAYQTKFLSNCDKVMIIQEGQVVEYDTPSRMYRNAKSHLNTFFNELTFNFESEL